MLKLAGNGGFKQRIGLHTDKTVRKEFRKLILFVNWHSKKLVSPPKGVEEYIRTSFDSNISLQGVENACMESCKHQELHKTGKMWADLWPKRGHLYLCYCFIKKTYVCTLAITFLHFSVLKSSGLHAVHGCRKKKSLLTFLPSVFNNCTLSIVTTCTMK